ANLRTQIAYFNRGKLYFDNNMMGQGIWDLVKAYDVASELNLSRVYSYNDSIITFSKIGVENLLVTIKQLPYEMMIKLLTDSLSLPVYIDYQCSFNISNPLGHYFFNCSDEKEKLVNDITKYLNEFYSKYYAISQLLILANTLDNNSSFSGPREVVQLINSNFTKTTCLAALHRFFHPKKLDNLSIIERTEVWCGNKSNS